MNPRLRVAAALPALPRLSRRTLIAAFLVLVAFRVAVLLMGVQQQISGDGVRFYAMGHAPGVPYADYAVEYPPVFVALVKLLAFATPDSHGFTAAIVVLSLVAEAGIAVLLWRTWSARAMLWYLAVDMLLVALFMARVDLIGAALVVAAVAAGLRGHPVVAALCFVLAIGLKLWPLPLAVVVIPLLPPATRRTYVLAGLAGLAALLAAWLSLDGVAGIQQVLTFRGATGWQVESVIGSVVRLFTGEPSVLQSGADRFGHVPPVLPAFLQLAAAGLTVWVVTRVRTRRDVGVAWVACVGAFLLVSTLFSPQFIAWLIPAGAIAFASGDVAVGLGVAAVAITTVLENGVYLQVLANLPEGVIPLLVRNLALLITVMLAVRSLHRRRRVVLAGSRAAERGGYSGLLARLRGQTAMNHVDDAA